MITGHDDRPSVVDHIRRGPRSDEETRLPGCGRRTTEHHQVVAEHRPTAPQRAQCGRGIARAGAEHEDAAVAEGQGRGVEHVPISPAQRIRHHEHKDMPEGDHQVRRVAGDDDRFRRDPGHEPEIAPHEGEAGPSVASRTGRRPTTGTGAQLGARNGRARSAATTWGPRPATSPRALRPAEGRRPRRARRVRRCRSPGPRGPMWASPRRARGRHVPGRRCAAVMAAEPMTAVD